MRVAIIGGGIMGVSIGYFLTQEGIGVDIFEASPTLGGLAGQYILKDGIAIDRFYHAVLSSDSHLHQLCIQLGMEDELRFKETQTGFYHQGTIYPMNNIVDFLRFPPLRWIDRFRLGLTVLYAQFVRDWQHLEGVSVQDWLLHLSGRQTFENIWRPMLKAKFDGGFESTPATYIWARLVRMKSTRSGATQKEMVGHLIGGHISLINAMATRIEKTGGTIQVNLPIDEIYRRLIPNAMPFYLEFLSKTKYLGILSPILILDRPLSGFWTLNITDDRIPFTGIIETTTYIDPEYVGGHHLVYLPKYIAPGSSWQQMSDEEIQKIWLQELETMFPQFHRSWIRYFHIHREPYVEPLHQLNGIESIPPIKTPIGNLYLVTTNRHYPKRSIAPPYSSTRFTTDLY
jgi:protoporphyrinogen oxidase